ncbi:YncE family protein [Marinoscillum furvescens]|uniref:Uncharacterized protein n=1 Tax=Marinoscillum furvescens DSM 4134 TaxID=1122208 RepID=A0A3D9L5V9_MARFU|nr:DUF5074 domain-containing protein [Marinoscillum furvescens]RED99391.1 hypothetical protein C7460_1086 [Marinoscillum furvescens DSM 4134]
MKKNLHILWMIALTLFAAACEDSAEEIVLDGISVDGAATQIKVSELTLVEASASKLSLKSSLVAMDDDFSVTEVGVAISSVPGEPTLSDLTVSAESFDLDTEFTVEFEGLTPGTVYYGRVYVTTDKGTGYGDVRLFSTEYFGADVVVINEGNFQSGDGSFSTYNTQSQETNLSVFAAANGYPLAATIQNAVEFDGMIYAVTNASDKLEILDAGSFESEAYISGEFSNPYAFAAIGTKGYVTNWGPFNANWQLEESTISVVDLNEHKVVKTINVEEQAQHVLAVNGSFYVSHVGGSSISVYNATDDSKTATIATGSGPDKMVMDAEGDLWVICRSGELAEINLTTNEVSKTITGIQGLAWNEKMVIDESGSTLYYLGTSGEDKAVYSLATSAEVAPDAPLITGSNFYGIGVKGDVIYVADNNGYQGNGQVLMYSLAGEEKGSFPAGRGPNGFIFR